MDTTARCEWTVHAPTGPEIENPNQKKILKKSHLQIIKLKTPDFHEDDLLFGFYLGREKKIQKVPSDNGNKKLTPNQIQLGKPNLHYLDKQKPNIKRRQHKMKAMEQTQKLLFTLLLPYTE